MDKSEARTSMSERQSGVTKAGLCSRAWPLGARAEAALDHYPGRMARPVRWGSIPTVGTHPPEQLWTFEGNPHLTPFLCRCQWNIGKAPKGYILKVCQDGRGKVGYIVPQATATTEASPTAVEECPSNSHPTRTPECDLILSGNRIIRHI